MKVRSRASPPGDRNRATAGVVVVLALGIGLRAIQYLGEVPLWHDEAAVALNLDQRGLVGLVSEPLDFSQMAPVGWLVLLEVATYLPGSAEIELRLIPFLVSVLGLFLFWRVARRFLAGAPMLAALLLFGTAPAMIWYSTTVKQYGADVTATIALVWLALRHRERPDDRRHAVVAGVGGAATVLVSFPAIVVAALLGAVLLLQELREQRRPSQSLLLLGSGWGLGAALAGLWTLGLTSPETQEYMREFWAGGFLPWNDPLRAALWVPERIWSVFAHSLIYIDPTNAVLAALVGVPFFFALCGLIVLGSDRQFSGLLLVLPTLTGILLGAAHVLPLRHRLGLYTGWPLIVAALVGIQRILDRYPEGRWLRPLAFVPAVPLVMATALVSPPPLVGQNTRPVLEELAERIRPSDPLYVTCGGRHAVGFYGPRVGIDTWHQGTCDYPGVERFRPDGITEQGIYGPLYAEIEIYRGSPRLWLFFTQSHGEAEALRERLEEWGTLVEELDGGGEGEGRTGAMLFDLSEQRTP